MPEPGSGARGRIGRFWQNLWGQDKVIGVFVVFHLR